MAVQLIPLIKALAPYVTTIATSAIPHFTSNKSDAAKGDPLLAQQIGELQAASTKNAQDLHILAEQIQKLITSTAEAAEAAKRQVATYKSLLFISLGCSIASLLTAIFSLSN
ncbi:hypothetical protein EIQ04_01200 [Xanthomonas campestris pv. raphani]|uniref:hypothetical protein n=1 Tax=Xanthomonas campestris TaxID=339 RepID=UPI002B2262D5|nr:hypothetical protein [Xanthomonas campestris]MEA9893005.1 hypothetical protein [Xanthomonas campestris pv. raphani]